MPRSSRALALVVAAGLAGGCAGVASGPAPVSGRSPAGALDGSWLDRPLASWNAAGGSIPPAPRIDADPPDTPRCAGLTRPATSAEDRALAAAGWRLIGPAQVFEDLVVMRAAAAVDGMCRPLGYQGFVFVEGRFAGTLSPLAMHARTDGAERLTIVASRRQLLVEFSRYRPADPLCCPSAIAVVTFEIDRQLVGPVAVPRRVTTTRTR